MKLRELVCDPAGRLSHTRLWANIAFAAATVIVIRLAWGGHLSVEFFATYLIFVGATPHVSKFMALRYGGSNDKPTA